VVAYGGKAAGTAVKVGVETVATVDFPAGSVLVCDNTDVRFLPLMQKAAAILTERGGMLSHAAIIARELKKPCLVGVKGLMAAVSQGQEIAVDAEAGSISGI
jgi:pyruvate,water dikinase